jgi:dynein heavy chain
MEETNAKIDKAREAYRPAAMRASLLFFVMVDLASIDSMYQYSVDSYLERFRMSVKRLAKEKKATEIADRVSLLNSIQFENVYRFVVRGVFEKHKILFSFQM